MQLLEKLRHYKILAQESNPQPIPEIEKPIKFVITKERGEEPKDLKNAEMTGYTVYQNLKSNYYGVIGEVRIQNSGDIYYGEALYETESEHPKDTMIGWLVLKGIIGSNCK